MDQEQAPERPQRKNRIPDGPRAFKKSISFQPQTYEALMAAAREEGHNNLSRIVADAAVDYLNRRYDVRAA